jgi:lipopolysaccharide transport system ATP-binding protein
MTDVAITVENLGKMYRIGGKQERYKRFTESVMDALGAPLRRLRNLGQPTPENQILWALKDVSFAVKQGEVVGIIGRNGAGKSTLLKVLSRITEPTTGEVRVYGRVGSLLEVGTGFHPELTGRENVFLNGAILGMRRAEIDRRFDEIVAFAEVEKFLDTPVKRYSSGMYVRLAFAVAAHLEPEILVVDEVLAVGDGQFQKKCLGKMGEVAKGGRTVLFVSHNLTTIRTLCSRTLLLNYGMCVADGPSDEVVRKYTGSIREGVYEQEWSDPNNAPQNESIRLGRVSVQDEEGNPIENIYTDTAFNIEIEFMVKTEGTSAGLTIIFYDNENNCVFSSINNKEANWYGKTMPIGIYKSVCKIPANFFNNGWFNVSVNLFGKNFSDARLVRETLKIEILDGSTVRGDYFGEYCGVVRPALEWRTELTV